MVTDLTSYQPYLPIQAADVSIRAQFAPLPIWFPGPRHQCCIADLVCVCTRAPFPGVSAGMCVEPFCLQLPVIDLECVNTYKQGIKCISVQVCDQQVHERERESLDRPHPVSAAVFDNRYTDVATQ